MATSAGKQLIFDSRYGWVYDEWRDPLAVAHLGGRGMFSILPLSKATLGKAVHVANKVADLVAAIIEEPPSLESIRTNLRTSNLKVQKSLKNMLQETLVRIPFPRFVPNWPHTLMVTQGSDRDSLPYEFELVESNMQIVRPILNNVMDSGKESLN